MKTVEEIYRDMIDRVVVETGIAPDGASEMAVRLYALAAQIYGLYEENAWTRRQCFPQTATGEDLEKHGFLRGVTRIPGRRAEGKLRFSLRTAASENLPIPVGSVCMTAGGGAFETTREAVILAGKLSVDVPAQAVEPGLGGNVPAGVVRTMAVAPAGVSDCTNPVPFTGGRGREEDEELRLRILDTYRNIPNGTNKAYYAQEALAIPGVAAVKVIPKPRGMGTVDVIIASATGMPNRTLVNKVKEDLATKREIAVDLSVKGPEPVAVQIILSVQAEPGVLPAVVIERVKQAMETWFDGTMLGRNLLLVEIAQRIHEVPGVANYRIDGPVNDVIVKENQLPVLGSVSVEEM